ncbi:MAG: 5-oxoprolinase subunit PxpB [Saprospiraceae bacterium]|nr:5-oxoprolinase subunit PxpB [Saprospiraceae bacterium]
MKIVPLGTEALLVDFGHVISPAVNGLAISLARQVEQADLPGVRFCAPAYASVTVGFDPRVTTFDTLAQKVKSLVPLVSEVAGATERPTWRIPVCYHERYAPDLSDVLQHTGLEWEELIALHSGRSYRVYMLGFLPGFTYLGSVDARLVMPRKAQPRTRVPAGSVGIAGEQTGIYPVQAPGGWQLIGRTPVRTFDPESSEPFLIQPGDHVRFEPVAPSEFEALANAVVAGTYTLASDG